MTHEEAIRAAGLRPSKATAAECEYGVVVTDGAGNQLLVDGAGTLWWYGKAANGGLPLFVPPAAVDATGQEAGDEDPPVEPTIPVVEPEPVPDGTARDVIDWVSQVPEQVAERAARALDAENARPVARSTLVKDLEKLAGT